MFSQRTRRQTQQGRRAAAALYSVAGRKQSGTNSFRIGRWRSRSSSSGLFGKISDDKARRILGSEGENTVFRGMTEYDGSFYGMA